MNAIWYRARAELRARWRAMVALALLAGFAGGAAIAAGAGARRTETAYLRFAEAYRGWDVNVSLVDTPDADAQLDAVARLPMVEGSTRSKLFAGSVTTGGRTVEFPDVFLFGERDRAPGHAGFKILEGRLSDPARVDEAIVGYVVADQLAIEAGDRVEVVLAAEGPDGPVTERVDVTVSGVMVTVSAFETLNGDGFPSVFGFTPAFTQRYAHLAFPGESGMNLLLRGGETQAPALVEAARAQGVEFMDPPTRASAFTPGVRALDRVAATALWVLAIVLALGGLAVLGQAIGRELSETASDRLVLRALGLSRRGLMVLMAIRVLVVGAAGGILAVVVAVALSPLTPIGLARIAEPDPGIAFDATALAVGVGAVVVGVMLAAVLPIVRLSASGARVPGARPARAATMAERTGFPPSASSGIRLALDGGAGGRSVPVRIATLGGAVSVAILVAALSFGTSLGHLLEHPELSGYRWDGAVIAMEPALVDDTAAAAGAVPEVERAWRGTVFFGVDVDEMVLPVFAADGVDPPLIAGRAARNPAEIVLDPLTLDRLGKRIGDRVRVQPQFGDGGAADATVVGTFAVASLPFQSNENPGQAASMAFEGLRMVDPSAEYEAVFVRFRPGVELDHGVTALREATSRTAFAAFSRKQAATVRNVGRLTTLPTTVAALLAVLGVATLAHVLVLTIRRRRRDLAILKTIGFVRRQLRATVAWQATTIATLSLVAGIPLGLVAGRWGWRWFADYLRVIPAPRLPVLGAVLVLGSALAIANLIATAPAGAAARTPAGEVLRAE